MENIVAKLRQAFEQGNMTRQAKNAVPYETGLRHSSTRRDGVVCRALLLVLVLSLATGAFTGNGNAQTVATLTTPPNVTLNATNTLIVTGTNFVGTITNGGSITINTGGVLQLGQLATANAVPPTITLTGGGPLTLAGGTLRGVVNQQGSTTALINLDNSITGAGTITTLGLTNQATINANAAGGTLTFLNFSITNKGTLQASLGGTLTLSGPNIGLARVTNQPNAAGQGGSILSSQGGTVELKNVGVQGGFLDTQGTGVINATGNVGLSNLTVNGTYNVGAGTTTGISAPVRNNGTINVPAGGTIRGASLINGNKVAAAAGATVALSNFTQSNGSFLLDGILFSDDPLQTALVDIQGGLLTGTGAVIGTINMAGTFQPGDSAPGLFNVQGRYDQTASGTLDELLGGTSPSQFSQTQITGSSSLAGLLDVSLFGGFSPSNGDVFPILEATNVFTGFFDNAVPAGPGLPGRLASSAGMFDVNYNVDFDGLSAVVLSNFTPASVPEPASFLLLGTGLVGLAVVTCWSRRMGISSQGPIPRDRDAD